MRKSKWLVFLMAVILCMVSVSAAFAKVPPLEEDETDAMEQRICELLQNEGYKTDYWKDVRSINIRYMDDYYHITLETKKGKNYGADVSPKGTVLSLASNAGTEGSPEENPKLDKDTMKKIQDKVDSFLKEVNPDLLEKIGKLKVQKSLTDGDTVYVEVVDSNKKVFFELKIEPTVQLVVYTQRKK